MWFRDGAVIQWGGIIPALLCLIVCIVTFLKTLQSPD